MGTWIAASGLVRSFAYIDETTYDTWPVIGGLFAFDPEDEPRLYDLGIVGDPVFGSRLTGDSRSALQNALVGVELRFIADWRSFVANRERCGKFANGRRALRMSAPMPHHDQGLFYLVAVNVDHGTCEGLTYVLEVGWNGTQAAVLRIVREGDWVADYGPA